MCRQIRKGEEQDECHVERVWNLSGHFLAKDLELSDQVNIICLNGSNVLVFIVTVTMPCGKSLKHFSGHFLNKGLEFSDQLNISCFK